MGLIAHAFFLFSPWILKGLMVRFPFVLGQGIDDFVSGEAFSEGFECEGGSSLQWRDEI